MAEHEFFSFNAFTGTTYWISTELIDLEDTVMYLMDGDLIQITQNDNAGRGTRASMIQWQPDKCDCRACSGDSDQLTACNYFIKVRSYNPTKTGSFQVRVATQSIPMPGSIPCLRGNQIARSLTSCNGYNGDNCIYICFPGYIPAGRHQCGSDGEWAGGSCVARNCTEGRFIENSLTTCSGATNDQCSYVCDLGYLAMGTHTCQPNGRWSGGRCEPKICTAGNNVPNSQTTCRGRVGDAPCNYICNPGFSP
jgi:hypothetical protein